jgi:hypothetical protein
MKDRKQSLYNCWLDKERRMRGPNWAGQPFINFCRLLLTDANYFDNMSKGHTFRRGDALDIIVNHYKGNIDVNTPYPWEWKGETNELR